MDLCVFERQRQDFGVIQQQCVLPLNQHAPETDGSPQQATGLLPLKVLKQKQDDEILGHKEGIQISDENCTR